MKGKVSLFKMVRESLLSEKMAQEQTRCAMMLVARAHVAAKVDQGRPRLIARKAMPSAH